MRTLRVETIGSLGICLREGNDIVARAVKDFELADLFAVAPQLYEALRVAVDDIALAAELAMGRDDREIHAELSKHLARYHNALNSVRGKL